MALKTKLKSVCTKIKAELNKQLKKIGKPNLIDTNSDKKK